MIGSNFVSLLLLEYEKARNNLILDGNRTLSSLRAKCKRECDRSGSYAQEYTIYSCTHPPIRPLLYPQSEELSLHHISFFLFFISQRNKYQLSYTLLQLISQSADCLATDIWCVDLERCHSLAILLLSGYGSLALLRVNITLSPLVRLIFFVLGDQVQDMLPRNSDCSR